MNKIFYAIIFLSCALIFSSSAFAGPKLDTATFATGCFWCTEAKFMQLKGVVKVESGFAGGKTVKPTYKEVCTGTTGHAETCNIVYNPAVISYDELLEAFFTAHDPTSLNRQGNDVGTQYRSAIFYHGTSQKQKALFYIKRLNEAHAYKNLVVTEVSPYTSFYPAAKDMQNFYNQHPELQYCKRIIAPELAEFKKAFKNKVKQE